MLRLFLLTLFFISRISFSQNYKITYLKYSHENLIENQEPTLVFANKDKSIITNEGILKKTSSFPYEITVINTHPKNLITTYGFLNSNTTIATIDSLSQNKYTIEVSTESKKILGYTCFKATTTINSNKIEIWFTKALGFNASPSILGNKLGTVLEINRNGNFRTTATSIEKIIDMPKYDYTKIKFVDELDYKDLLFSSRMTKIKVFNNEQIHYSSSSKSTDSILKFANGTVILRKINFPFIKEGSQIFAQLIEQSNGDAYDRTGSVFFIPAKSNKQTFFDAFIKGINAIPQYTNGNGKTYQGIVSTETYESLIEAIRFFTPFGVRHFNYLKQKNKTWQEEAYYRQEISEFLPILSGNEIWVGIFIGNYDEGGHNVSLEFSIHNDTYNVLPKKTVIPLFNTTNVLEMKGQEYGTLFSDDNGLEVSFTLDKPLKNAVLRYIVTGHGGWQNGDEFLMKKNLFYLNEKEIFHYIPWRQDCGSYRLANPASGNFSNGLSSSDYSRANWCPGTITYPIFIDLGNLQMGNHKLKISIPQGKPEGNSFSAWNVSGILLAD